MTDPGLFSLQGADGIAGDRLDPSPKAPLLGVVFEIAQRLNQLAKHFLSDVGSIRLLQPPQTTPIEYRWTVTLQEQLPREVVFAIFECQNQ